MSAMTIVALGLLAWVPSTVLLALFLGRMIRLRDQRRLRTTRSRTVFDDGTGFPNRDLTNRMAPP